MDLGIAGRKAIVCAASRGLGLACARALAREGVVVVMAARRPDVLEEAATLVAMEGGPPPVVVVADVTTEEGRAAILKACEAPDILVNNAGGPPPGDFRDWSRDDWVRAVDANMLSPIAFIKATVDGMIERRFGRIVNITSAAVKAPIPNLGLSNGARAGLTGFVAGLARQTVAHNVTINNLLPGPFETDRLDQTLAGFAKAQGLSLEEARERRRAESPARRFGDPAEFGTACAFLCGARAGYITGQNLVLDGGAYPGTL
jgi:3-oxoacyl-[acyl-carrier protein] reductase